MLPDILAPDLRVVFVGSAKSVASFEAGHYYAHPQNGFWRLLHATGLTDGVQLGPERDREVLRFGVGLTDLVHNRVSSSDAALRAADFDAAGFVEKIERLGPRFVAFNAGRSAESVARHLGRRPPQIGPCGWQVADAHAYRLPSSSPANARGGFTAKRAAWVRFGEWLREVEASTTLRSR